jgi:hypothetical protein
MAVLAAATERGDGHGVGVELFVEELERGIVRLFVIGLERREFRMGELVSNGFGHEESVRGCFAMMARREGMKGR